MLKICMILLAIINISFSQDVEDIIEEVQEKYDELKDLSADFKRVESFKLTGTVSETGGKIFIKDGVKYRFESEDQVIVTDGVSVWTYNALTQQLIIDRVRENSGAFLPRDMLFKYPKEYYSTLLKEEELADKKLFVVKLDPKGDTHGFIKSMKIWVEDDEWLIHKVEVIDLNGNTSAFEVTNISTDNGFKDDLFSYSAKEGTQIVDMR